MRALRPFSTIIVSAAIVASASAGFNVDTRYDTFIPYVPSPEFVVDRMLEMAEVTKDDLLLDLGSGDGRIVITAAQRYGARGRGVEIDPGLVAEARKNAREQGVADLTEFVAQDMFVAKIADASVLTLYVLTASNLELRPRILSEMKPGSRVVSHQFSMGSWLAEKQESYGDIQIYMWTVPANVAGQWRIERDGRQFTVEITQEFQEIRGNATFGRTTAPLRQARLKGAEIDFAIDLGHERPVLFRGRVNEGVIEPRGAAGDTEHKWRAIRVAMPKPPGN
jgi:SAM-dependent methyltransferase